MTQQEKLDATLLLVDDQPFFLKYYSDILTRARYQVVTASDGEEALEKARGFRPDIIVMDMEMPTLDGIETCKRLKAEQITGQIPVVIITATQSVKLNELAFHAGAQATVTKSMNEERFLNILEVVLRTAKASDSF